MRKRGEPEKEALGGTLLRCVYTGCFLSWKASRASLRRVEMRGIAPLSVTKFLNLRPIEIRTSLCDEILIAARRLEFINIRIR